jgi:biotin carboxylase
MAELEGASTPLPKLAYVFEPTSFATLALYEAAHGRCELLWVVDASRPEVAELSRLLVRLGTIVDVAGLSLDAASRLVADHEPAGILALADDALRYTADLAEQLGLAFHTPACAYRLTDKHAQRRALEDGGLIVPRSWVIALDADDEALDALGEEVCFPAVLKPRRGEASRDTLPVASLDELRAHLESLRVESPPARAFVLEEFISDATGTPGGEGFAGYVSVESFVTHGEVCHVAITGRMPPAYPFRETGFFIPSALDAEMQHEVLRTAAAAATALGISIGCLHTEIKLTDDGPVVIEVNGRIGGGVPELLAAVTDVRFLSVAMRLALGERIACEGLRPCERLAFLFYVHAPLEVGVVTALEGVDELRDVPGIDEVVLRRGVGESVDWREGNHGHVLSVFGTTDGHDGLRRVHDQVARTLRIKGSPRA